MRDVFWILRLWLNGGSMKRYPVPSKMPKPEQIPLPWESCDRCGAEAQIVVYIPVREQMLELLFCMHHFRKFTDHVRERSYPFKHRKAKL